MLLVRKYVNIIIFHQLLLNDDILVVALVFVFFCYFRQDNLFRFFVFFSLSVSLDFSLFIVQFSFLCLVACFDGLRPLLVASHCQICSLANKPPSFVRSHNSFTGKCLIKLFLPVSNTFTSTQIHYYIITYKI